VTKIGVYRHSKTGVLYRVLFTATDATNGHKSSETETGELSASEVVVYMSLQTGKMYTRPVTEFHDRVDVTNWSISCGGYNPNAVDRFVWIGNEYGPNK
jgi:hypothetical protein